MLFWVSAFEEGFRVGQLMRYFLLAAVLVTIVMLGIRAWRNRHNK
ncbi:hypothetical protein [Leuconostoc pseudomesenteroides]